MVKLIRLDQLSVLRSTVNIYNVDLLFMRYTDVPLAGQYCLSSMNQYTRVESKVKLQYKYTANALSQIFEMSHCSRCRIIFGFLNNLFCCI